MPQVIGNVTSGDKIANSGAREACESRFGAQFWQGSGLDQLGTLVDDGYHSVPLGRGQSENDPVHSGGFQPGYGVGLRTGPESGDVDRCRVPPCLFSLPAQ